MREQWQVAEIINADGLPVRVLPIRVYDESPPLQPGEEIRWLAAACPISGNAARRLARMRLKMIGRFAGRQPDWLQQHVPTGVGKVPARAVCRTCGDRVEQFPSVRAAARAVGRSRAWLHLRLVDGMPDFSGCTWRDTATV
jgi:hypothetical protein